MSDHSLDALVDDAPHVLEPPKKGMSVAAKMRVVAATSRLSKMRCLIENTHESNPVQFANCLDRSTADNIISHLEYVWNLAHGKLNLDSRYNVIRLSSTFHRLFNRPDGWLLLPEKWILDQYKTVRDPETRARKPKIRENFPVIEKPFYEYRLVPHDKMAPVPIHRQKPRAPGSEDAELTEEDFTYHQYPFEDFPVIKSHVHPRYIICNSGIKLARGTGKWDRVNLEGIRENLLTMRDIWQSWSESLLDNPDFQAFTVGHPPNHDRQGDDNDNNSHFTRSRRAPNDRKRYLPPSPQGSPSRQSKGSKSRRLQDSESGLTLSDEYSTLNESENQSTKEVSNARAKTLLVESWLETAHESMTGTEGNALLSV